MSARSRAGEGGELAIVLHSHMPYVEGFGTWPFGEEWLLEAIAVCYLPLIEMLERWADEGQAAATVGITPVLADQLELPETAAGFLEFMNDTRVDCHRLDIDGLRADGQEQAARALELSARDYEVASERFERRSGDLLGAFGKLRDAGTIDLWSSAATHAVLPLLETEAGVRLQLRTGIASHRNRFAGWTGGLWLPECAYRPGLEQQLAEVGVRAFCVDQSRTGNDFDQLEPIATEAGPVAIPIDWRTIELVWDSNGYPSDPIYRDYHAPTINGLRAWANSGAPYDRDAAFERARGHAAEFVASVIERLDRHRAERGRPGLLVCALDTELLGHWWYEGIVWLDAVASQAREQGLELASLPQALERHESQPRPLIESSWGAGKDLSTWDSPEVEHLRWPAVEAELALAGRLAANGNGSGSATARAARELLALQSSDWAFMEARKLAADYPSARVRGHREAFLRALAEAGHGMKDSREMPPGKPRDQAARQAGAGVDAKLRGLAPSLELSGMTEPASPWGRQVLDATDVGAA